MRLARRRGTVAAPAADEPDLLPTPGRRRWHQFAQAVVVLTMVGATAGVMGIVVQTSVLLGRMTTEVSIAQQRTTNLHNLQLANLHLLEELTELDRGEDTEAVTVRRGLMRRMVTVVRLLFPATSAQAGEMRQIDAGLDRFPWTSLDEPTADWDTVLGTAKMLVSQIDVEIKALYDEQEKFFYDATLDSLQAKRKSQNALALLVSLVVVLAVCWLVSLRRRTRNRLVLAYTALVTEVSERRILQDQLTHQAFHDALTGLPNRALLLQRLAESMPAVGRASGGPSAVLVDLDGFKNVNDTLGHHAGDELLQRIAERFRDCVRPADTVGRLGGDEFAVVVPAGSESDAVTVSRRVLEALQAPIKVAGKEISISASIGIAHLDDQSAAEDLLSDADIAMYAAKNAGKARYQVFRRGMRDETMQRARLEQQLARAVDLGEIHIHYQPIVDLGTDRVVAVEALARWAHPQDGTISPAVFIPIAEQSGLIREIGRDVLRRACRTVRHWRESVPGSEHLSVTVNVSVRQLLSGMFADHVRDALRESGLPPAGLTLEITESMLLEESDVIAAELARIQGFGVRLAMDDFGAGYSSLATLLQHQVNVLKIDKAFLDLDHRNRGTLIRAVTELGHTLGLTVVAEGVETADQLTHVRAANCDAAQGYLLARPMPEDATRRYLASSGSGRSDLQPAGADTRS
jgi:diguanylate cyclase (GGDEF)-like protein